MKEMGFWDYTAPQHGSLECYREQDWDLLLEDLAAHGINSFVLSIKWMTTGYRSRFSWLDQNMECTAIQSDNQLIHYALREMRKRGMKVWLLLVVTQFPAHSFGLNPTWIPQWTEQVFGYGIGFYDVDHPGLQERVNQMLREVAELFGEETDGIILELEWGDREEPHRIPLYNQWASQNNRPDFDTIRHYPLQSRSYPFYDWRDFATQRRIYFLQSAKEALRAAGFTGELATINEIENGPGAVISASNLTMLRQQLPDFALVTYDGIYNRNMHRRATQDLCMDAPIKEGHKVYFLSRGVMPWADEPGRFGPLSHQWEMTLEDCRQSRPEGLWMMGTDCRVPGMVCSLSGLQSFGYRDGRQARLELLKKMRDSGLLLD